MGIEHIHADVALFPQCVGAAEHEQRRVPEPQEVGHVDLLVGEDEAEHHDQQFGDDEEQGEPGDADRPSQRGDDDAHNDQGHMDVGPANFWPCQAKGEGLAEKVVKQALAAQEGEADVNQADQQDRPERGADQERVDLEDEVAVRPKFAPRIAQDMDNGEQKRAGIKPRLRPGAEVDNIAFVAQSTRPAKPISEEVVE